MIKEIIYIFTKDSDTKRAAIRGLMPRKFGNSLFFRMHYGRWIDFKNPELMDEKLLILQLQYNKSDTATLCTDKYLVRDYIEKKGYGQTLNGMLGVYEGPDEIDWNNLPKQCAIKCVHGSGYNVIVKDKDKLDIAKAKKDLTYWLKEDYGVKMAEPHYSRIKPRIIIEEYLADKNGNFPPDYKFFVSRGEVIGCMIAAGRDTKLERLFVDKDFNDLGFIHEYTGEDHHEFEPACYKEMLKMASDLGKDFPFVRVDLYDNNGKIVFGELTFTPNSCLHKHFDVNGQKWIGEKIRL